MSWNKTVFVTVLLLFGCASTPANPASVELKEQHAEIPASSLTLEEHVLAKLKEKKLTFRGYRDQLHEVLQDPKKTYERIIALNLLGFMGKADYSVHYSERAIEKARKFLKQNGRTLRLAQKKYGVSKESIAALLWVETQYGKITGKFPLIQVYLSLLMADHPEIVRNLVKEANDRRTLEKDLRERYPDPLAFEQKVVDRTHLKSDWAIDQLKAIDQLRRSGYTQVLRLTGSFAGAFGVPQFIPSTYRDLAVSPSKNRRPNLFKMPDVIMSVANFLKKKGWKEKIPESKTTALYEYNRIKDYGDVILKIAAALREPNRRQSSVK